MEVIDLKPGCGAVLTSQVGCNKITLVFSSDADEATKARQQLVYILQVNSLAQGHPAPLYKGGENDGSA